MIAYGYCHCGCGQKTNLCKANDSRFGYVKDEPARYLRGHQFRRDPQERFWEKVVKAGPNDCWLWTGNLNHDGYGRFWDGSRIVSAHRQSYVWAVGPIPIGAEIVHVRSRGCRHRNCVNPTHLEAVVHRENVLRGNAPAAKQAAQSHCRAEGHALSGDNLLVDTRGRRRCRECTRKREREYRRAQRQAAKGKP